MSVFQGRINEYPCIAVDNFTEETFNCTAFFLSHCHKDHMDGLESDAFLNLLKSKKKISLYCSETTRNLMQCDKYLRILDPYLKAIPLSQATMIQIPNENLKEDTPMFVTLIPAGHCVGSVMFLFEGAKGTVLYTGDFRLKKGDIRRVECLQETSTVKKIKELYIDTTFCCTNVPRLPSREETKNAMVNLMKSWFQSGENHAVFLQCSSKYGYEYILKELAIEFKTKIHVDAAKFELYTAIPGMSEFVTAFGENAQIHSCSWKNCYSKSRLPCGLSELNGKPLKIMKIKPSTLWFFNKNSFPKDLVNFDKSHDVYRIIHSMHSSYEEIADVVSYLQPVYIYPTVAPIGTDDVTQAYFRLRHLLDDSKTETTQESMNQPGDYKTSETKSGDTKWKLGIHDDEKILPKRAKNCHGELGIEDEFNALPKSISYRRKRHNKKDNRNCEIKNDDVKIASELNCGSRISSREKEKKAFKSCEPLENMPILKGRFESESDEALFEAVDFVGKEVLSEQPYGSRRSDDQGGGGSNEFDIPASPGTSEPTSKFLNNYYLKLEKESFCENVL